MQQPRLKERRRGAVAARVASPPPKQGNRRLVGRIRLGHVLEQQRQQRVGVKGERVGLNGGEIVSRQFRLPAQQIGDPLSAVGLRPFESNQVRIRGRSRPVVGGDDKVLGRIVGVWQFLEGHPSCPF